MSRARPQAIVLTGGGSGGHITPILAVASELKKLRPEINLVYVGQTAGKLSDIPKDHPAIDKVYTVRAGKFRRYKGEGIRQVFDMSTQAKNLRDAFWVCVGLVQSYWLMRKLRPSVIFTRGGYVSVPVALGGKLNGVPYITHDSDSTPSLANRLIARWAAMHAVALPIDLYPYPKPKTVMVGVPVGESYMPVESKLQHRYRKEIGLHPLDPVAFVSGGGNGADALNKLVAASSVALLDRNPRLNIVHIAGRMLEQKLNELYDEILKPAQRQRVHVKGFVTDLYRYSGAADVAIVRGGASTLAELAVQGKACVVIPAPQLVWQIHHAQSLADHDAVLMLNESKAAKDNTLADVVNWLLNDAHERQHLADTLARLGHSNAANAIAMLLLEQVSRAKS